MMTTKMTFVAVAVAVVVVVVIGSAGPCRV